MRRANIDVELSLQMLQTLRENQLISSKGQSTDCKDFEIPVTDGQSIIDFSSGINYKVSRQRIEELLSQYPELAASSMARRARDIEHSKLELNEAELSEVGLLLSPVSPLASSTAVLPPLILTVKKTADFLLSCFKYCKTNLSSSPINLLPNPRHSVQPF